MTFDPSVVSYEELLDLFWGGQPNYLPHGPDPRVHLAVMPRGQAQRAAAERAKAELRRRSGEPVHVDIVPDAAFWPAERMHQKFTLQRRGETLLATLAAAGGFGDAATVDTTVDTAAVNTAAIDAFLASTAAARLNAWLGPFGDDEDLAEAADALGMEPAALSSLLLDSDAPADP